MINIVEEHLQEIGSRFDAYKTKAFRDILSVLTEVRDSGKTVYLGGNGGSAALVSHFATDWTKGLFDINGIPLKSQVLNSNLSLLTATANDLDYESSLSRPIEFFCEPGDVVLLVSSSGRSPNILRAAEIALERGLTLVGLSGFGNSELIKKSNFGLTFDTTDYQVIEDLHAIFGHVVFKYFASM
jgi:D-sedoheptulose 7-phosphate isomerase